MATGKANVNLVTTGAPKSPGALFWAPAGTEVPTDASTELPEAFKCLGFVDAEGVKQQVDVKENKIDSWGGTIVLTTKSSVEETYEYTLIEALNVEVLKHAYGEKNVTGSLETGVTLKHTFDDAPTGVWVAELKHRGDIVRRIVVPNAQVVKVEPSDLKHDQLMAYKTTLAALADSEGVQVNEYIAKIA